VALWVVRLEGGTGGGEAMAALDAIALAPGLLLVRSALSQSRLYHLVKREAAPESLFVGRLAERPKFTGMRAGSLAALRDWGDEAAG
jgi:hypothetical protein